MSLKYLPTWLPWKVLNSRYALKDKWIRLRNETVQLPNKVILSPWYTLEYPDWVCVVAITRLQQIVLVEQYRHGVKEVLLELPAGSAEEGEDPLAAVKRELSEETGYVTDNWYSLGSYYTDAARHTNRAHAFLAMNVEQISSQRPDEGELLNTHLVPWPEFAARLGAGSLKLTATHLACLFWLQRLVQAGTSDDVRQLRIDLP